MIKRLIVFAVLPLLVVAGVSRTSGQGAKPAELVMYEAGGASGQSVEKGYLEPFTRDTGIRVKRISPQDFGKLRAMVASGAVTADLWELGGQDVEVAVKAGLLEKLDYAGVPVADLYKEAVHPYALGFQYYSTVLAWRTGAFPKGPTTWKDFWDVKKFPGPRAIRDRAVDNLEFALLADGVPPDKVYPIDVERAFRKLNELKPHIATFWTAGAQPPQLVIAGEVVMTTVWSGRVQAVAADAPVQYTWNQGILHLSYFTVPKGAPNRAWAMKLFPYLADPKNQARAAEVIAYTGPSRQMIDFVPKDKAGLYPTSPANYGVQMVQSQQWWAEHQAEVEQRWNEWKLQK